MYEVVHRRLILSVKLATLNSWLFSKNLTVWLKIKLGHFVCIELAYDGHKYLCSLDNLLPFKDCAYDFFCDLLAILILILVAEKFAVGHLPLNDSYIDFHRGLRPWGGRLCSITDLLLTFCFVWVVRKRWLLRHLLPGYSHYGLDKLSVTKLARFTALI